VKAAVIQFHSSENKKYNIQKAVRFVCEALQNKAQFVVLPEVFHYRGAKSWEEMRGVAEKIPGESTLPFMDLARRHKAFILCGSIYEKIPATPKVYNTSVLINPRGKAAALYRKMHLFDAVIGGLAIRESEVFRAGQRPVMSRVQEFNVGLSICYDLRFPELYQTYSRNGAHVVCVPSCFTKMTGQAHWEVLLKARAIENLCYVLAPNQTGKDARGILCFGHSMIVDPWGKVLAAASRDKEEVIYAHLHLATIEQKRKILPKLVTHNLSR